MEQQYKFNKIYSSTQENNISGEFKHLKDNCYLDHVGATLYSEKQLQNICSELCNNIFSNPHASKATEDCIDIIRYQILDHFNTTVDEYSVIFTSGATRSLQIVGECFMYNDGLLAYLESNHTSVLGMRKCTNKSKEIKIEQAFRHLHNSITKNLTSNDQSNNLFVYPAQCNFSGTKFPLTWINSVKNGKLNEIINGNSKNWFVLLDCANYVSCNKLDLSKWTPDFIPISFYKIFGYPTGLGALLVKRSSEHVLVKKYFGGGTVLMALSSQNVMIPRHSLHERFEDGTLPFLSIVALKEGFGTIKRLNLSFDDIGKHTFSLARYVYKNLQLLHHCNGKPVAILYHDTTFDSEEDQGGIVNFNLLRLNGEYIGYSEVLHFANLHGIQLRTGCFCNPGACQRFLGLTAEDVQKHFDAGHVCGDQNDLVDNYPTGSVRISFGYMTTKENADSFIEMIKDCFVTKPIIKKLPANYNNLIEHYQKLFVKKSTKTNNSDINSIQIENNVRKKICSIPIENSLINNNGILEQIYLYPIKSCGSLQVKKWFLTPSGLKYDRQWMIVNASGIGVTQKHNRRLCLIKPEIILKRNVLKINFKGISKSIEISLNNPKTVTNSADSCKSKVCGDQIQGWDCGDDVANWLSDVLETPGLRLIQHCTDTEIKSRISKQTHKLSLANKAQYLLLNTASVEWLKARIPEDDNAMENLDSIIARFRPNFVTTFNEAFQENEYDEFLFGNKLVFKSGGKCTRCQMICIDQNTGETSKEPLATLSREFKGKISFGLYLNNEHINDETEIQIGIKIIGENVLLY